MLSHVDLPTSVFVTRIRRWIAGQSTLRSSRAHCASADREMVALAKLMTFTTVIGNADGHGKNVALLHNAEGRIRLAPAYDTVPTMLWPKLRTRPGMYIGGVADLARVDRDALIREATGWKMNKQTAITTIDQTLELLRAAVVRHDELAGLVATNLDRIQRQLLHD